MRLLLKCRRGSVVVEKVIKWILALGIIVAVGFAAKNIIGKFA